jgi:hypothetical protein
MHRNTNKEKTEDTKQYHTTTNKELAAKGRFLISSSVLLFLQCNEYIKLKKLPIIGATIEDTATKTITYLLLFTVFYSMYKYCVYKRDSELTTNMHTYSEKLRNRVFAWCFSGYLKRVVPHILSYKFIGDFSFCGCHQANRSPAYIINKHPDNCSGIYDWSNYELKKWEYKKHKETHIQDIDDRSDELLTLPDSWCIINVSSSIEFKRHQSDIYGNIDINTDFRIHPKTYKRIKKSCDLIAYLTLPDFIERAAPYFAGFISIIAFALSTTN